MSDIVKNISAEDSRLPYYHGALMDQDVEGLLQTDGDFLLQVKHVANSSKPKLFLVVKKGKDTKRLEIKRSESGNVKVAGKTFPSLKKLVESFQGGEKLAVGNENLVLRRAVPRGRFQLNHADIKLTKKIGSGAYGTVYRGVMLRDQRLIAVKRLDSEGADADALAEMMKEARVMQLYDHKNIVRFYGFIVDRMPYLLVMEFCDSGSVEDKLRSAGKKLTVNMRVDWCAQAAAGMEYLHSKECIHRDIAARNCLLDKGVVKMADFGMCRPTAVYKVDLSKPTNVRWLAPEVWSIGETRYNTDVYAFGVMIWEMFEIPYNSPYSEWKASTVKQKVMGGYRMQPSEYMPDEMVIVMELAWHHDPSKRPTATGLRKMLEELNKKVNGEQSKSQMSRIA